MEKFSALMIPILLNMGIIITMSLLGQYLDREMRGLGTRLKLLSGLMYGIAGIVSMTAPLSLRPGLFYDGRSIILAVAGVFGGPVAAGVAALMTAAYRIAIGGPGALVGTLVILEAAALGSLYGILVERGALKRDNRSLLVLGLIVHILMIAIQFLLPDRAWERVVPSVAPVVLLAYPLAFMVVCRIFIDESDRGIQQEALRESETRYREIFRNSLLAKLIVDPASGMVTDANLAASGLLKLPMERIIGAPVSSFLTGNTEVWGPEKLAVDPDRLQDVAHFSYRSEDGVKSDFEVFTSPIVLDGKRLYYTVLLDETERVRHRRVLENELAFKDIARSCSSMESLARAVASFLARSLDADSVGITVSGGGINRHSQDIGFLLETSDDAHREGRPALPAERISQPIAARDHSLGRIDVTFRHRPGPLERDLLQQISREVAEEISHRELAETIEERVRQIAALSLVDRSINGAVDIKSTLDLILGQSMSLLKADAMSIFLLDRASNRLTLMATRGFRAEPPQDHPCLPAGKTDYCTMAERGTDIKYNLGLIEPGTEFSRVAEKEGFRSLHCAPLVVQDRTVGLVRAFHRSDFHSDPDWVGFFETIARQAAIALNYSMVLQDLQQANESLRTSYDATLEGWARAVDLHDHETEGHSRRVTVLATLLAERMGLTRRQLYEIRCGALLHDIGKIGVPDSILNKPGKLDEEEFRIMKRHPQLGYEMLKDVAYLGDSIQIPWCHHERWDGTGYPRGLSGEDIPLPARIFSVVDVWDAMTSDRSYRPAMGRHETLEYITRMSGSQFDPAVVARFLELIGEGVQ